VKAEVFSSGRERGKVRASGRRSDRMWESVGDGGGEEATRAEGQGKRVRVRDGGRIGGLRDCLQRVEQKFLLTTHKASRQKMKYVHPRNRNQQNPLCSIPVTPKAFIRDPRNQFFTNFGDITVGGRHCALLQ